ncbi:MAG TPA: class I SAM-dependent methyltransferase [Candidatus Binataceae bacterium]|nr:class I SAM-dependent methyltransferase [Candidatus Binataceae bacterium]
MLKRDLPRAGAPLSSSRMEHSIYEFPEIFRRVHKEQPREIAEEVAFLRGVFSRHLKRPVRRLLDLAAGDSPHGQLFASDGIAVVGVDRSPTMIAAGRAEARRRGLAKLRFHRRAIEKFHLAEKPFDAAIFMSETFPVMTRNEAILDHFRSVGALVRRGGIYCIDIDRMHTPRIPRKQRMWRRRKLQVGAAEVEVWADNQPMPWYSGVHSIFDLQSVIRFSNRTVATRDLVPVRYTLPCTLDLAARASAMFRLETVYTDLSFTTPLEECDRRWLGVLRRV